MKSAYLMYLSIAGMSMGVCVGIMVYKIMDFIILKDLHKRKNAMIHVSLSTSVFTAELILFVELVKVVRYL